MNICVTIIDILTFFIYICLNGLPRKKKQIGPRHKRIYFLLEVKPKLQRERKKKKKLILALKVYGEQFKLTTENSSVRFFVRSSIGIIK